jgi:hypothetical protein
VTDALRPDFDLIDAIDNLPFGRTWTGVAEFAPDVDRHAFIVGRTHSGKTHVARSIAVASIAGGDTVINATSRDIFTPEDRVAVSTRLEHVVQSLSDGSRIYGDPRIIVIADESVLRGRNAAANLRRLEAIIDAGPDDSVHLVLLADDPRLTNTADLDELDAFTMPTGILTVLLGSETEPRRSETFGRTVHTADPGLPGSGLIATRDNEPEQFRAWLLDHEDATRILAP